jgi:hypothetical protein
MENDCNLYDSKIELPNANVVLALGIISVLCILKAGDYEENQDKKQISHTKSDKNNA